MYIYITFYKCTLTDKVRRKAIHVVDEPSTLFKLMNGAIARTEWNFFAYQLNCDPQNLYSLYRGFYNSDIPPVISDGFFSYFHGPTQMRCRIIDCLTDQDEYKKAS